MIIRHVSKKIVCVGQAKPVSWADIQVPTEPDLKAELAIKIVQGRGLQPHEIAQLGDTAYRAYLASLDTVGAGSVAQSAAFDKTSDRR
jgi:hypothetical protein